jgi:hypothetical protein
MSTFELSVTARLQPAGFVQFARRSYLLLFTVALLALLTTGPAKADKRVALVVGNSTYKNVTQLDNSGNDARLMAETLRNVGFTLVGSRAQIDLDKTSFDDAIQSFGNQLAGADVALFYYAGHGVQIRGSNYMVPISANPTKEADVDFQMVNVALVLRQMEGSGTKLNLLILDACRNNPFGARGLRSTSSGLAQMQAPEGTLISYATQPGNVAQDGTDGDSPYTKALVQTIKRAGLDIFQTFNEVGLAVKRSTRGQQQPWVSSSPIDGNFYFVSPAAGSGSPPVSNAPSSTNEAAQAWAATKDATNPAVLEAFIQHYGATFYADLARARLDELKTGAAKPSPYAVAIAPTALPPVSASAKAAGSGRAVLYEEDPSNPKGQQHPGSVLWRTDRIKAAGQPDEIVVRADIDIPDLKFKMQMSFKRNTDKSLPASHVVELTLAAPPDYAGGDISSVPGMLMKSNEQARGVALAGLGVKVSKGFFLIGLSNVEADRTRNLQSLGERSWFDIPMVYANRRRGILAIEKGNSGQQAFDSALVGWQQPR